MENLTRNGRLRERGVRVFLLNETVAAVGIVVDAVLLFEVLDVAEG
jgi:hypothetical protein